MFVSIIIIIFPFFMHLSDEFIFFFFVKFRPDFEASMDKLGLIFLTENSAAFDIGGIWMNTINELVGNPDRS